MCAAKSNHRQFKKGETHMAFCANCGAAVTDGAGFCGGCGKAIGTSAQVVAQPVGPGGQATAAQPAVANVQPLSLGLTSNVAGALCYILGFITGILFLVLEPHKH